MSAEEETDRQQAQERQLTEVSALLEEAARRGDWLPIFKPSPEEEIDYSGKETILTGATNILEPLTITIIHQYSEMSRNHSDQVLLKNGGTIQFVLPAAEPHFITLARMDGKITKHSAILLGARFITVPNNVHSLNYAKDGFIPSRYRRTESFSLWRSYTINYGEPTGAVNSIELQFDHSNRIIRILDYKTSVNIQFDWQNRNLSLDDSSLFLSNDGLFRNRLGEIHSVDLGQTLLTIIKKLPLEHFVKTPDGKFEQLNPKQ
ncbi:hypothetical protein HY404_04070 [Candidatus Microgenomates bacterium]|nr:hypothetical protein [Candidatus Microgenomates bacterium]